MRYFELHAVFTVAAVVVSFMALDDITTDTSQSFAVEHRLIALCGVWFVLVARRLWTLAHRLLSAVSLAWVAVTALAQPLIGSRNAPDPRFAYVVMFGGIAWFLMMAWVLQRGHLSVRGRLESGDL